MDCGQDSTEHPAKKRQTDKEVYVLHLQSGAKYVGESDCPKRRFDSHRENPNDWVRCHGGPTDLDKALTEKLDCVGDWEEKETLLQMLLHGPNLVRGAQHTSERPFTPSKREELARTLCQHAEACFTCGRCDCRAHGCTAKRAPWLLRFVEGDGCKGAPASVRRELPSTGCPFSHAVRVVMKHETREEEEPVPAALATQKSNWSAEWQSRTRQLVWEAEETSRWSARLAPSEAVLRLLPVVSWKEVFAVRPPRQREFWLLECSTGDMRVEFIRQDLQTGQSFLLDFQASWPADVVEAMEHVTFLIHVDDAHVWAVSPREVRQEMVHVGVALNVAQVAACLATCELSGLTPSCPRKQSQVTVMQDPPGSGKTYSIVRRPLCPNDYPECEQYDTFIYITKPHAAKEVVHREFNEQLDEVSEAVVLEEGERDAGYWKKIEVQGRNIMMLFVTGDSLFARLGSRHSGVLDQYEGICATIAKEGPQTGERGAITLKGKQVHLCAKTLVCMDEATKFTLPYAKALARIVYACNSDAIVSGDYLQSIETPDNVMAHAMESKEPFPGALTIKVMGNKIRRCGPKLVGVIRTVVPWEKYNLPLPEPAADVAHEGEGEFTVQVLSNEDRQDTKVERVIGVVRDAVMDMQLLPNDVLCVFLFVSKNPFGDALRDALHHLWRNLLEDADYRRKMLSGHRRSDAEKYFEAYNEEIRAGRYVWLAHFHRSEEGRPVQTKESVNSTRMVSVHAAQGDGRRLALIFQLSEMGLKQFYTRGQKNLCYFSFINIACSRAKVRTIAFQGKVYDDIWRRFSPYMDKPTRVSVEPLVRIDHKFNIEQVGFDNAGDSLVHALSDTLLPHLNQADKVKDPQPLVDFEHHQVRCETFHLVIMLRLLAEEASEQSKKKQILAILHKVSRLPVKSLPAQKSKEYHFRLSQPELEFIPLLNYSLGPNDNFAPIHDEIRSRLEAQLERIRSWLDRGRSDGKDAVTTLVASLTRDPKDIVVLRYAIDCAEADRERGLRMDTVYDIFKSFESEGNALAAHYGCLARAQAVADKIVTLLTPTEGRGEWLLYLRVNLGQSDGGTLPCFSFGGQMPYVHVTDTAVTVVECRQQIGTVVLSDLSSSLLGHDALLRQPAEGHGSNYHRFSGKRLSFLLVSMCTGWTKHVKGFDDLHLRHRSDVYDTVCHHAETMCTGFHDMVVDFHEHCCRRRLHSIDRFRALRNLADAATKVWAPTYVEDSLVEIRGSIEDAEENGDEPLPEFGCGQLRQNLDKHLRRAVQRLRRSLLTRASPSCEEAQAKE